MRIHPPKLTIDENEPFKDALFDRKAFADSLTILLRNVSDNLVVLVHAPWGAGKTTFANMWRTDLMRQKLEVIYFDAYASDYFNDPFVSFSGEILELSDKRFSQGKGLIARRKFKKSALEVGKRIAGLATKIGLRAATLGAIEETHIKELKNIASDIASGLAEIGSKTIEERIKNYAAEKDSLVAFKKDLAKLAAVIREEQGFPLTIIVDELDRCRPDFALALLERIKHLFDVDGVAFLLFVNRDQIESYIKAIHGNVDAAAYLLKFGNLFVDLPTESEHASRHAKGLADYCEALFTHFDFPRTVREGRPTLNCLKTLASHFHPTLRELEKIFTVVTIYHASRTPVEHAHFTLVATLAVLKVIRPDLYRRLSRGEVSCSDFFTETRIDQIKHWSGDLDNDWPRLFLRICLMSQAEFDKAAIEEKTQRGRTTLLEVRDGMGMDPKTAIPIVCSRLDRFAIQPVS